MVALWNRPSLRFPFLCFCLLTAVAICLARMYVGLYGMVSYTHDAFALLDGGWRVLNGQIPHLDFYTGLGSLLYLQSALGLLLANGKAEGLGYIQGITGIIFVGWTFLLCVRRISFVLTGIMCVFIALLTVTPMNLGELPSFISPAMAYNRYGYALMCLVLMEAFTESPSEERGDVWGGISTGVAGALMLFSKVSYFFAFGLLLVAGIYLKKQRRIRWVSIGGAFAAVSLLVMAYLRFHTGAVLHDLSMVAASKHVLFGEMVHRVIINIPLDGARSILIAVLAAAFIRPYSKQGARAMLLAAAIVNLVSIFLLGTNYQMFAFPVDTAFILLVLDRVNSVWSRTRNPPVMNWCALLLGGVFCVLASILPDLTATLIAVNHRRAHITKAEAFEAPPLANFTSTDTEYVEFANDGFELLREKRRPGESIMCLDFSNPFSYGLQARPAPGGTTWLQYDLNFDDVHRPSGQELMGSADLVMVPIRNGESTLRETVPRLYGPYLAQHFTLAGESDEWRLFRRNH